jgi:hypothetical protein
VLVLVLVSASEAEAASRVNRISTQQTFLLHKALHNAYANNGHSFDKSTQTKQQNKQKRKTSVFFLV